jgi:hypothetical protein
MKQKRTPILTRLLLTASLLCFSSLIAGCSKEEKSAAPSLSRSLASLLPQQTLGFLAADGQSEPWRNFMNSPGYRNYLRGLETQLSSNKAETGDWGEYFGVLKKLRFWPEGDAPVVLPFGKVLFFAAREAGDLSFAGYYDMAPGNNGQELLREIRGVFKKERAGIEPIQGTGYEGFSISIFDNQEEIAPILKMYRDTLKIRKAFIGASANRLVLSTSKALLDRGFGPANNDAKAFLDSTEYRAATEALGSFKDPQMFGALNASEAKQFVPEQYRAKIPFTTLGMVATLEQERIFLEFVAPIQATDPQQVKYLEQIPPARGKLFSSLAANSSAAWALDGATLNAAIKIALTEGAPPPNPQVQAILDLVKDITSIGIAATPKNISEALPYPAATIVIECGDAKAFAQRMEGLTKALGAPFPWIDAPGSAVPVRVLQVPLAMKLELAAVAEDIVMLTVSEGAIAEMVTTRGTTDLRHAPQFARFLAAETGPAMGLYLDYAQLGSIASRFAGAGAPAEAVASFEQMKHMGRIGMLFGYQNGVARISMSQEFAIPTP